MAFNGSGTFNLLYNWEQDAANNIDISAPRMDAQEADMATNGLSLCLTRDGQGSASANLPMNGYVHTGVGNATLLDQYASASQAQTGLLAFAVAGGTGDAITANYSPAVAALVDGMQLSFRASAANTLSNPTFAPNGFTAHTITKKGGSALSATDIRTNQICIVNYNLANTRWELLNSSSTDPSSLVVPSADIIVGNASNVGTAVAMSGDATISNTGVVTIPKGSSSTFGIVQVDNVTITASGGVISAVASGLPLTSAHIFVGNGSNDATDVAMSGDATITNAGVITVTKVNGDANVAFTDAVQTYTKSQRSTVQTLSAAASTITPDFDTGNDFTVTLVHANSPFTFANPSTTPVAGQSGIIEIIQSATGSDTITTWGSDYVYEGGTSAISLSSGANARDYLSYYVADSTHIVLAISSLNATH